MAAYLKKNSLVFVALASLRFTPFIFVTYVDDMFAIYLATLDTIIGFHSKHQLTAEEVTGILSAILKHRNLIPH